MVIVWCSCLLFVAAAASADGAHPHMLVIYSNNRLLPANIELDRGLQEALPGAIERNAEFLDAPRFMGEAYDRTVTAFLREKYRVRPPGVIVTAGTEALLYLLKHHAALFPEAPVVHTGVTDWFLRSIDPLPADVVGTPIRVDFSGTIALALRLWPGTRRLVLVTGASMVDRQFGDQLQEDAAAFRDRAELESQAGLPSAMVLKRLSEPGDDAAVVTPGYFADGAGHAGTPSINRWGPSSATPTRRTCCLNPLRSPLAGPAPSPVRIGRPSCGRSWPISGATICAPARSSAGCGR